MIRTLGNFELKCSSAMRRKIKYFYQNFLILFFGGLGQRGKHCMGFHSNLHFLTHQPNEPSGNNTYKPIPLFNYLYVWCAEAPLSEGTSTRWSVLIRPCHMLRCSAATTEPVFHFIDYWWKLLLLLSAIVVCSIFLSASSLTSPQLTCGEFGNSTPICVIILTFI